MSQKKSIVTLFRNLLFTFAIVLLAMQCFGLKASAQAPSIYGSDTVLLTDNSTHFIILIGGDDWTITNVTSSNNKVISICKQDLSGVTRFAYRTIKKGTSTLTVKIKKGSKRVTLTKKMYVSVDQPFTSITYNKKEIYKGNEYTIASHINKPVGKRITYSLKEGYEISSVYYSVNSQNPQMIPSNKTSFKLNFTPADRCQVTFEVKLPNKKIISYTLFIYGKEY